MSDLVTVYLKYGFSNEDCVTMKKAFFVSGDMGTPVFGSQTLDMASSSSTGAAIKTVADFLNNYIYILSQVARGGVKPLEAGSTIYANADLEDPRFSISYDAGEFINANPPGMWGPRGKAFVGCKQYIPLALKTGWLRWYYVAKELNDLPPQFPASMVPNAIGPQLASLSNFGSSSALDQHLLSYATQTRILSPTKQWVAQNGPTTQMHFGLRNG